MHWPKTPSVRVLLIYSLSRALTALLFLGDMMLNRATPGARHFDNLLKYLSRYDSQWYRRIAENGYPTVLPLDQAGDVAPNNWAFLPGFPSLIKPLQQVTGLEWWALAPTLATVFGGVFVFLAFKIFRLKFDEKTSLWAIVLLCFSMAAPALSIGYADSLGLALSALALYLILKDRYLVALLPIVALSVVRPGAIVFAAVFLGLAIFKKQGRLKALAGMAVSGLVGIAWPVVVGIATKDFGAYFATENAWRRVWTHSDHIGVFQGWFVALSGYVGPLLGIPIVLALLFLAFKLLRSQSVKALGLDMHLYLSAVLFYVFAVFFPQTSTFRILLPAFPVFAAIAYATIQKPKRFKVLLVASLILSQALWVWLTYSAYPFNLDIAP